MGSSCSVTGDIVSTEKIRSGALITIAGMQAAGAFAIAELQKDFAEEQFLFQKEVWETQKAWAAQYHDHWASVFRPYETAFFSYLTSIRNYSPQYGAAGSRASVAAAREFNYVRRAMSDCIDNRCSSDMCLVNKRMAQEEARVAVGIANRAYRAEEARQDAHKRRYENAMLPTLGLGRNIAQAGNQMINDASGTAATMASIDPYSGFATALGNLTATVGNIFTEPVRTQKKVRWVDTGQLINDNNTTGYVGNSNQMLA